jgi:hypothetical protein
MNIEEIKELRKNLPCKMMTGHSKSTMEERFVIIIEDNGNCITVLEGNLIYAIEHSTLISVSVFRCCEPINR